MSVFLEPGVNSVTETQICKLCKEGSVLAQNVKHLRSKAQTQYLQGKCLKVLYVDLVEKTLIRREKSSLTDFLFNA